MVWVRQHNLKELFLRSLSGRKGVSVLAERGMPVVRQKQFVMFAFECVCVGAEEREEEWGREGQMCRQQMWRESVGAPGREAQVDSGRWRRILLACLQERGQGSHAETAEEGGISEMGWQSPSRGVAVGVVEVEDIYGESTLQLRPLEHGFKEIRFPPDRGKRKSQGSEEPEGTSGSVACRRLLMCLFLGECEDRIRGGDGVEARGKRMESGAAGKLGLA